MKTYQAFGIVGLAMALVGCSSIKPDSAFDHALTQIQLGMTKQAVYSTLGQPVQELLQGDVEWDNRERGKHWRGVIISFGENGRVKAIQEKTGVITVKARGSKATMTAMLPSSIKLFGKAGTPFIGFYVHDGQRVAVSAILPWRCESGDITEFEFHKVNPHDGFTYEFTSDCIAGGPIILNGRAYAHGVLGVRGEIRYQSMTITPIIHVMSY